MAPSCLTSSPVCACLATTVGIDAKPKLVINSVFFLMASFWASASAVALMPPPLDIMDASCVSMAATGSAAARMVAPCEVLAPLRMPTGIQTNFACDFNGFAAYQSALQWGHWASKNTYTVRALMGEPTVNPLAPAVIASMETSADVVLTGSVVLELLQPATNRVAARTSARESVEEILKFMLF